jgi:hypothetical protein
MTTATAKEADISFADCVALIVALEHVETTLSATCFDVAVKPEMVAETALAVV